MWNTFASSDPGPFMAWVHPYGKGFPLPTRTCGKSQCHFSIHVYLLSGIIWSQKLQLKSFSMSLNTWKIVKICQNHLSALVALCWILALRWSLSLSFHPVFKYEYISKWQGGPPLFIRKFLALFHTFPLFYLIPCPQRLTSPKLWSQLCVNPLLNHGFWRGF